MSSKILRGTGFVLMRKKIGEADRLATIFSKEFGKIIVLAKSARKLKAKNIGKLEPYYLIDFQFIRGKSFNILTSVNINKSYTFYNQKEAKIILQTIFNFTPEEQSDPKIYWLIDESFHLLHQKRMNILPYFKLKFWFLEGLIDAHQLLKSKQKLDQLFSQIINHNLNYYLNLIETTNDQNQINRLEKAVDLFENRLKPN
ncbi:DNA repair protein RecO [Candidatus Berkelbacteria bacterium CG_4_10_14_0_8_um_filter_35_9_33_8]|uniref:DNA repair protein RecO n=1 Tax=Candidatus Berkelbacteria bacterium CG_4_10_14_0_2_um_filter_35_9_33_12 TaxID=1974499 RepID=A0A2M7W3X1_9BACT|nr:MAG: DNA repair protein RecO [Candidatus Berkelbacteria bacterium CG23_combo_of_CG06-09_8_20_14_all_33_15]PIS08555.1 MAG: DNA repair protein RecO [Candidatus Berkelbacteria bacterium CG10_big_fil_rev_8_21_14_0_10_33_10]PIZ27955.1 MAG: DNA repair protein RecO [Candidatus Berkelbacteria bacterium CG_4_10_14_0_8_um_filter_35_9_33_8]PJA20321.1 MAG: DNA repair protein RecO [Candidatus Berkelbacteria bacterium CG_4_10_14_0_2_um_filter_35_9_33_12]